MPAELLSARLPVLPDLSLMGIWEWQIKERQRKLKNVLNFCRKPAFWGHTGHTHQGVAEESTHVFLKAELSIKNPDAE